MAVLQRTIATVTTARAQLWRRCTLCAGTGFVSRLHGRDFYALLPRCCGWAL